MRTSEAREVLDPCIQDLGSALVNLNYDSVLSKSVFSVEYKEADSSIVDGRMRSMEVSLIIRDLGDPDRSRFRLSSKSADNEQFMEKLIMSFNQQQLWFLVGAFEELEKFLKDLFACLGYLDPSLWKAEDFGAIRIGDISSKDLLWYKRRVRSNRRLSSTKEIRARLRGTFPILEDPGHLIFSAWQGVVEQMRHFAVHQHGVVDATSFLESITKATGLSGNHRLLQDSLEFLRKEPHESRLWLLSESCYPLDLAFVTAPFEELLRSIAESASYYYRIAVAHFGKAPLWVAP